MNVQELIDILSNEDNREREVCIMIQPHWPLQFQIHNVFTENLPSGFDDYCPLCNHEHVALGDEGGSVTVTDCRECGCTLRGAVNAKNEIALHEPDGEICRNATFRIKECPQDHSYISVDFQDDKEPEMSPIYITTGDHPDGSPYGFAEAWQ